MTVKANHPSNHDITSSSQRWYPTIHPTHWQMMPISRNLLLKNSVRLLFLIVCVVSLIGIPIHPQPIWAEAEEENRTTTDGSEEIIFIDGNGVIQVIDLHQSGDSPLVKWQSPVGGWRHAALGDFNNDTDLEIVAVGGGSKTGKLAIYDPVVASGGSGKPQINNIPWDTLYETDIVGGKPLLVGAGNLDGGIPGDEIIYVIELEDAFKDEEKDITRATVIKPTSLTPDGRAWQTHIEKKHFDNNWSQIAIANVDISGTDEIALANEDEDEGGGKIELFRIGDGFERFWNESSTSNPWRSVSLGQVDAGGPLELVATRKANKKPTHMFVYRYENNTMVDSGSEGFTPYPRYSILADVNGSGDDEIFLLRRDSSIQLIMRNRGGDGVPEFEQNLDEDDQYRTGAAGDVDGDGRDELLVIRPDRLRLYTQLEADASYNDYNFDNNRFAVIGDLDKIGFVKGPELRADKIRIEANVESGRQAPTQNIQLTNIATDQAVPFSIVVEGNPSWVTVQTNQNQTPATIFVAFTTDGTAPGTHKSKLIITSSDATVTNQPYEIELSLTVVAAAVSVNPQSLSYSIYPCETPMATRTTKIEVSGSSGLHYTAAVMPSISVQAAQNMLEDEVMAADINEAGDLVLYDGYNHSVNITKAFPSEEKRLAVQASATGQDEIVWGSSETWISASSRLGITPDILTVTVDPNQSGIGYRNAMLVIVADERAGARPSNVRFVDMSFMCATSQLLMPFIAR